MAVIIHRAIEAFPNDGFPGPVIDISGDNPLAWEAGVEFVTPIVTAFDAIGLSGAGDGFVEVTQTGSINPNSTTTQYLYFDAVDSDGNEAVQATLQVDVADTIAPVITINGENPKVFIEGDTYVEDGATAVDSFDGSFPATPDTGSLDMNTAGEYGVPYSATDIAGNVAKVKTRTVIVQEAVNQKPVITLIGANPYIIPESSFPSVIPGATMNDPEEGDITDNGTLTVTGTVTWDTAADYPVAYNGEDSQGAAADEVIRTVRVVAVTASTELHTLSVKNIGGSQLTTPYVSTGLSLAKGQVNTATQTIEVRKADGATVVPCQMEAEANSHSDGTLAQFSLMFQADTIAAGDTDSYRVFVITGSKDTDFRSGETEADSRALVTAHDYKLELTAPTTADPTYGLSGTWTAKVNDCLAAGELVRDGPLCRRWRCFEKFDSGGDHANLWAMFFVTLWDDGTTICTMPIVFNGYVQAGNRYKYDVAFKDGVTTIFSDTDISHHHHSMAFAVDADGNQHWSANEATIFVGKESDKLQDTYAFASYMDINLGLMSAPNTLSYTMMFKQIGYRSNFNNGGEHDQIGPLPNWSTRALLAQNEHEDRYDRVMALTSGMFPSQYREVLTSYAPVYNDEDYSSDGLGSVDRSEYWKESGANASAGGQANLTGMDPTHYPEPVMYQACATGDEWFIDMQTYLGTSFLGLTNPSLMERNFVIGARTFPHVAIGQAQWQERGVAWLMRTLSNGRWICPDNHPMKNYLNDLVTENFDFMDFALKTPYGSGGIIHDEVRALGVYRYLSEHGGTYVMAQLYAPWQEDFIAMVTTMGFLRGHAPQSLVENGADTHMGCRNPSAGGCAYSYSHVYLVYLRDTVGNWYGPAWGDLYKASGGFPHPRESLMSDIPPGGVCPSSGQAGAPYYAAWVDYDIHPNSYSAITHGVSNLLLYAQQEVPALTLNNASYVNTYMAIEEAVPENNWANTPKYAFRI
ncbi:MAG: DUF5011 domain-containing protein [Gammaproteobacteria bacterium]|nr:DUF5011 domain-containing protein [Gammaproteobacteria bacterium]